jgi:lipoprotein-anchoring transpeptidase ErfK/SrfK
MKRDAGYTVPGVPIEKVARKYRRQTVSYRTSEKPGTIIVDTNEKFLYYVMGGGEAMRYGIGVGREGFEWSGTAKVGYKKEWPVWTPPPEMIKRQPELKEFAGGMDPGPKNALGARALYLTNKKGDTGYRLHGTPEWWTIGKAMSSGCIRLLNQDIIDLYGRTKVGSKVIVI